MFQKHSFVVKMVKDSDQPTTATAAPQPKYLINVNDITRDQVKTAAKVAIAVYAGRKILTTACEAALIIVAK